MKKNVRRTKKNEQFKSPSTRTKLVLHKHGWSECSRSEIFPAQNIDRLNEYKAIKKIDIVEIRSKSDMKMDVKLLRINYLRFFNVIKCQM